MAGEYFEHLRFDIAALMMATFSLVLGNWSRLKRNLPRILPTGSANVSGFAAKQFIAWRNLVFAVP